MIRSKDIAYQNKDIASKVFAEKFKNVSLKVYGLDVPEIVRALPTNLPEIAANELRIDNLFELKDGTIALIDYESSYKKESKIKYLQYIVRTLERFREKGEYHIKLRMIVIYTADIRPEETEDTYEAGALTLRTETAFLSRLDSGRIKANLQRKVSAGEMLTEDETMEFMILPLTYRTEEGKKEALHESIRLASKIKDEETMVFVLAGILVFSDKIIDEESSKKVKEWIRMTKIGRLFEIEKEEAVKEASREASRETLKATAERMLRKGKMSVEEVAEYVPELSVEDIRKIQEGLLQTV